MNLRGGVIVLGGEIVVVLGLDLLLVNAFVCEFAQHMKMRALVWVCVWDWDSNLSSNSRMQSFSANVFPCKNAAMGLMGPNCCSKAQDGTGSLHF